ncbi:MAG: hypothetical protein E3J21_08785 [Anaerolineales bacterium]|nr:MAG: hypothetical protein E3J21_08785 [Anaerolineales bacterium]
MIQQVHATVNLASSALVYTSSLPWMVARIHLAICAGQNSVIQDRSIYEDAHIFARALHDMKMFSPRDYRAYRELYDLVIETLTPFTQSSTPPIIRFPTRQLPDSKGPSLITPGNGAYIGSHFCLSCLTVDSFNHGRTEGSPTLGTQPYPQDTDSNEYCHDGFNLPL